MGLKNRRIQLAVYEAYYEEGPTASVRFTEYDKKGSVAFVNQIDYWDEVHMDEQVFMALEAGLDVSIYTRCEVESFPRISNLTKEM